MTDQTNMRTVTYDRSDAVNLARNMLEVRDCKNITEKGVRMLCDAVLGMDVAMLAAAPAHPDTAGDAEDAARYRWLRDRAETRNGLADYQIKPRAVAFTQFPALMVERGAHDVDAAIDAAMRASKEEGE